MGQEIMDLRKFLPYISNNTITQADFDSGDSGQRIGHFFALTGMAGLRTDSVLTYEFAIGAHTSASGIYRRSADPQHWGYNPNNFSRDQWNALQLSFAVQGDTDELKTSMQKLKERHFLHQNVHPGTDAPDDFRKTPDLAHPSHFSVYIRGLRLTKFRLLLPLIDLMFLGDILLRKYTDSANDLDNMLAPQILYATLVMPTFVSKLAMKLYLRTNFMDKIKAYHSVERNGILPFPELIEYAYNVNGFKVKEV